jgi:hypothetical protein
MPLYMPFRIPIGIALDVVKNFFGRCKIPGGSYFFLIFAAEWPIVVDVRGRSLWVTWKMPENSTACTMENSGKSQGKPGVVRRMTVPYRLEILANEAFISEVLRVIKNPLT